MPAYHSPLTVSVTETPDGTRVTARGDIDLMSAHALAAPLLAATVRPPVLLDMTGVGYIDSAGMKVILDAVKALKACGSPPLSVTAEGGRQVARVLRLSRFHTIIDLRETTDPDLRETTAP